jgi:hypothetical protein
MVVRRSTIAPMVAVCNVPESEVFLTLGSRGLLLLLGLLRVPVGGRVVLGCGRRVVVDGDGQELLLRFVFPVGVGRSGNAIKDVQSFLSNLLKLIKVLRHRLVRLHLL